MMIKRLHLKNIQAHKDTVLDFAPGLNIIYGHSDQGKTTIARSIYELATNSIPADVLFRWGLSKTKHTAEITCVTDQHTITRLFGKRGNKYILDGEEFAAPKQGIPPQVSEALNISEINIQPQHSSHFLLTNISSGLVAKRLNVAVGLEDIDNTQTNINAIVRKIETERKGIIDKIQSCSRQLDELAWLEDYGTVLKKINSFSDRRRNIKKAIDALEAKKSELDKSYRKQNNIKKRLEIKENIERLSEEVDKRTREKGLVLDLGSMDYKLQQLYRKKKENDKRVADKEKINTLISKAEERENISKILGILEQQSKKLASSQEERKRLKKASSNVRERLAKYKEEVGICPLCGNTLHGGICE